MDISLVIPCFNEEAAIGTCLETVATQLRPIDEVIVVDNGSSDGTLEAVARYSGRLPLRILHEAHHGVAWASQAGYDAAAGDVIGRIDADSRIDPNWARTVENFLSEQQHVDAISGGSWLYDSPRFSFRKSCLRQVAKYGSGSSGELKYLSGNNMAMRREAWLRARPRVRNLPGTHEDLDLTYALREAGCRLERVPAMLASISARRFASSPRTLAEYVLATLRTQRAHGRTGDRIAYWLAMPLNVAGIAVLSYYARKAGLRGDRPSPVTD